MIKEINIFILFLENILNYIKNLDLTYIKTNLQVLNILKNHDF